MLLVVLKKPVSKVIGNSMNFSLCHLREESNSCFLKILSQFDACDRFYHQSCSCGDEQTITILSGRTFGTTLGIDYL